MNFLPVEFVSSRKLYAELIEDKIENPLFLRSYDGNMVFAEHPLYFFHFLFVFYFNDNFHRDIPPILNENHYMIICGLFSSFFIISIIRRISRFFFPYTAEVQQLRSQIFKPVGWAERLL